MNKRVSPAVIGAFVVASFAILVVALIVVGSGKMFTRPIRFICMFQGNLNGLKVGAPVKVRGVQIGTVAMIRAPAPALPGTDEGGDPRAALAGHHRRRTARNCWRGEELARRSKAGFDDMIKQGCGRSSPRKVS